MIARAVLARPTLDAARSLLGSRLLRVDPDGGRRLGRIVEVEAYVGEEDRASHARMGRTARNAPMFGPPGLAYVYLIYGMYDCLNVVTEREGRPAAVLVRAVEPLEGVERMRAARLAHAAARRRDPDGVWRAGEAKRLAHLVESRLASGPGLVCAAFSITRAADDGRDLCAPDSPLRVLPAPPDEPSCRVVATPRIGVGYAGEPWRSNAWRLFDGESPAVSGPPTGLGPTPGGP